ncbi:MAG: hypothetical protein KDB86_07275 [Actinobacteria bacterium]|nr:hypothetical protein [Actinomycetota bacterium]
MSPGRKAPWWVGSGDDPDSRDHAASAFGSKRSGAGSMRHDEHEHDRPQAPDGAGPTVGASSRDRSGWKREESPRTERGCLACSFSSSWRQQQAEAYDHALAAMQEMVAAARCLLDAADGAISEERGRVAREQRRRDERRPRSAYFADYEPSPDSLDNAITGSDRVTSEGSFQDTGTGGTSADSTDGGGPTGGVGPDHPSLAPWTSELIDEITTALRDVVEPLKPAFDAMARGADTSSSGDESSREQATGTQGAS